MPRQATHFYQESLKNVLDRLGIRIRIWHCLFGFFALVNAAAIRTCLDLAVKENGLLMKPSKAEKSTSKINMSRQKTDSRTNPLDKVESGLDEALIKQWVWIAFYSGYVITHIIGNRLNRRFGSKQVLTTAILTSALMSLIITMPLSQNNTVGVVGLCFFIGICEGPIYPALSALLIEWIPLKEKGKLSVFSFSGTQMGSFLIELLWSVLLKEYDWRWIFYICGCSSLLWCVGFILVCSSKPEKNFYVSSEEKRYIRKCKTKKSSDSSRDFGIFRWQDILKSPSTWALVLASIQHDWNETNINYLSLYEKSKLEADDEFYMLMLNISTWAITVSAGYISDYIINNDVLDGTKTRQLMTALGAFTPNLIDKIISALKFANPQTPQQILNCVITVLGTYYSGIKDSSSVESNPDFNVDELLMGVTNGMGSLISSVVPVLNGINFKARAFNDFGTFLWLICSVLLSGETQQLESLVHSHIS